jgi:uncharacterized membrane protein AbrB (regulator of aidB expression)
MSTNPNGDRRLSIEQTKDVHPLPWVYGTTPQAQVIVMDAKGNEVPLFTLLDFVCNVTLAMQAGDQFKQAA